MCYIIYMDAEQTAKKEKLHAKLQEFRLLDDDFMVRFFEDDLPRVQFVLQVILGNNDLVVKEATVQKVIKSLESRSVRLDVFARDSNGKPYDIEIQKTSDGAGARRARYNSSLIDADELVPGDDTEKLPETYIIFITEKDIYGKNQPLYKIERYIDGKELFNDGAHIIYVNGEYRGNDPIGDLMHDFSCKKASDMKNKILAEKVRYLKEDEKGVSHMCKIMEDLISDEKIELALKNLENGVLTEDQIKEVFQLTPEQAAKVLELYHDKVAVKA